MGGVSSIGIPVGELLHCYINARSTMSGVLQRGHPPPELLVELHMMMMPCLMGGGYMCVERVGFEGLGRRSIWACLMKVQAEQCCLMDEGMGCICLRLIYKQGRSFESGAVETNSFG